MEAEQHSKRERFKPQAPPRYQRHLKFPCPACCHGRRGSSFMVTVESWGTKTGWRRIRRCKACGFKVTTNQPEGTDNEEVTHVTN